MAYKITNKPREQSHIQGDNYEEKIKSQQAQEEEQLFGEPKQEDGI